MQLYYIGFWALIFVLASCQDDFMKQENTFSEGEEVTSEFSEDLGVTATIRADSNNVQVFNTNDASLSNVSVKVPPDSLSSNVSLAINPSVDITNKNLLEDLKLGADNDVSKASESIVIEADADEKGLITSALQISLEISSEPQAGLAGEGDPFDNLVVLYKRKNLDDPGKFIVGIFPRSDILIEDGKAFFDITFLGSFQLAFTKIKVEEAVTADTSVPILKKKEEQNIKGAISSVAFSSDGKRSASLVIALEELVPDSCYVIIDRDKVAPYDFSVKGAKTSFSAIPPAAIEAYTTYAYVECTGTNGKVVKSEWQKEINIPAFKVSIIGPEESAEGFAFNVQKTAGIPLAYFLSKDSSCVAPLTDRQPVGQTGSIVISAALAPGDYNLCIKANVKGSNHEKFVDSFWSKAFNVAHDPEFDFAINGQANEQILTNDPLVSIDVITNDDLTEIAVAQNNSCSATAFKPLTGGFVEFTLDGTNGEIDICAKVKNKYGRVSDVVVKSLVFDSIPPDAPNLVLDSSVNQATPVFKVSGTAPGVRVSVFSQASCLATASIGVQESIGSDLFFQSPQLAGGTHYFSAVAEDLAGNRSACVELDAPYLVDLQGPSIISVSGSIAGTYTTGQKLQFGVTFSEIVNVDATSGTPALQVIIDTTTVEALYASGSGSSILWFEYTIIAPAVDNDGVVLNPSLALNGGAIRDTSGNNVVDLTFTPPDLSGVNINAFGGSLRYEIIASATAVVGASQNVTVNVLDEFNALVTNLNGVTVELACPGSGVAGCGTVNIAGGTGTIAITDTIAETVNLSLTASSDASIDTSASASIDFYPEAAAKIVISDPIDGNVGGQISVTIQVQDMYGNLLNGLYDNDVTLVCTGSATGCGYVDIIGGTGTINISNTVQENVSLSLADDYNTGLDVTSIQDVIFGNGGAAKFVIMPLGSGTAGTGVTVIVQAQDNFGNIDNSFEADVSLLCDGSANGCGLVNIAAGQGSLTVNNNISESITLSLSDSQQTGLDVSSTQPLTFFPGAASKFYLNPPGDTVVGTAASVVVHAKDALGNIDTSFQNDVNVHCAGSSATGCGTVDIVNGVGSVDLNNTVAEGINLSLSEVVVLGLDISSTAGFNFIPGAATDFIITPPAANAMTGSNVNIEIKAYDQYANHATQVNGETVDLTCTGTGVTGCGTVTFTAGTAVATINSTVDQSVSLSLNAPSLGVALGSSPVINFTSAPVVTGPVAPTDSLYRAGQGIAISLNMNVNAFVTGAPRLQLDIGGVTAYADYQSGSGTSTLNFSYMVTSGDYDPDGISIVSPIDLNGGSLQDGASNNFALTFTPPEYCVGSGRW